jgi:hemerythrin-like domain-containing protein
MVATAVADQHEEPHGLMTTSPATATARTTDAGVDTTDYAVIHRSIRSAGHAIATAATTLRHDDHARMDAFVRYWQGHVGEIFSHHGVEDDIFFPALRERAPETAQVLDQLDAEHHRLDELMEACRAAIEGVVTGDGPAEAARRLRELAGVMDEHLDLEDQEIVPRFSEHFSAPEYEALTKAAIKQVGLGKQAAFTVPYIGFWATEEERVALLGSAPLPFRILYRLTRARHARLTELALAI